MRINIIDLHRKVNEKQMKKQECYNTVLEKCHRKIKVAAENQLLKCIYEVPEFIYGIPLYDLNKCIEYLIESLSKNGFFVKYYFPKLIYISWDWDEINQQHSKPNKSKTSNLIEKEKESSLIVRQPQSQQKSQNNLKIFKKKTGKLELNIF